MYRFARQFPLFSAVLLVLVGASLWPIWSVEYLPLLDWPQHLAVVSFLRHSGDPSWGFDRYLVHNGGLQTYLTFYYLSAWFAYLMPVEVAAKLVLSLYFALTPIACVYLLRSFDRAPWPALFSFVVLFNWSLYMGFVAFLLALPLVLFGIGMVQRQRGGMTARKTVLMLLVSLALFFTHVFCFLIFGAIALPLTIAVHRRSLRDLAISWASVVPATIICALWAVHLLGAQPSSHLMKSMTVEGQKTSLLRAEYRPLKQKLAEIGKDFNDGYSDRRDLELFESSKRSFLWLLALVLALHLARRVNARYRRRSLELVRPTLVVGVAAALYLLLPMSMLSVWALSPRIVAVAALFAPLLFPTAFRSRWLNLALFLPALLLGWQTSGLNRTRFRAFQKQTEGLSEVLAKIPRGMRVYGLIYDMAAPGFTQPVMMHLAAYYMARRGGMVGFSHFHYNIMPGRYRNIALAPYPGQSGEWRPDRFRYDVYGSFYDYLLVRGHGTRWRIRAPKDGIELVLRKGRYAVFRVPRAFTRRPVFSFREKIHTAKVFLQQGQTQKSCAPFRNGRFTCPFQSWSWVGPAQTEFARTYIPCIWAHPIRGRTIRIRFDGLPKGDRIEGILGVADSGFPGLRPGGAPVELEIVADGKHVKTLETGRRPGYQRFDVELPGTAPRSVEFRVRAQNDGRRHFCFTATLFRSLRPNLEKR